MIFLIILFCILMLIVLHALTAFILEKVNKNLEVKLEEELIYTPIINTVILAYLFLR